jgi:hypothetical protein
MVIDRQSERVAETNMGGKKNREGERERDAKKTACQTECLTTLTRTTIPNHYLPLIYHYIIPLLWPAPLIIYHCQGQTNRSQLSMVPWALLTQDPRRPTLYVISYKASLLTHLLQAKYIHMHVYI